jgi:hypothetical protein
MGKGPEETAWHTIRFGISEAFGSIWSGIKFLFGYGPTKWSGFVDFFHSVFIPYFLGGLLPGFITAIIIYFASKPLVKAYQQRRRGRLMEKIKEIRDKKEAESSNKDISK